MTGTILTILNYAVHDGPGIRTLVFMKGCPLRCSWCCNPESQSARPQLRYISFRCKACLECVIHCPSSSVSFGGSVIQRSFETCNHCDLKICIEKCNHDAISISGREITSAELTEIIARDIPFYRNSGGGVTFSGGEPLAQPAFLFEMLQQCKALDIHTAVETCGWADRKALELILPYTDLFLFDLKVMDPDLHITHTGKTVVPILENLAFLASRKAEIIIRLPLIPGITDTLQNLESVVEVMRQNNLLRIDLEPYHTLGKEKYEEHGMAYKLDHLIQYNEHQISDIGNLFHEWGFLCEIV
ncbi:MAG: glycyl-radical enzyme activating protein [Bacteroidota bacterium]